MEYRTLEITLQYAKDLNNVNLISKMDVYAVVSISGGGDKNSHQKIKTPADHEGDANPNWDFPMKFTVEEPALQQNRLTLDFKLICERALGDKDVGEVHVPVKELLDSPAKGEGKKQIVSYQVRKPSGKPKGQVTFSYQFSEKTVAAAAAPPYAADLSHAPPPAVYAPEGYGYRAPPGVYPPTGAAPPPIGYHSASGVSAPGVYPPNGGAPPPIGYPPASGASAPGVYPPPATADGGGYHAPPSGYPPVGVAPVPGGYAPAGYGYPPPPPPPGYGYPPHPGYGYPPNPGYGYPPAYVHQPPKRNNNLGLGLGAGLLGGAIGGLLLGDVISDAADYGGGFDF